MEGLDRFGELFAPDIARKGFELFSGGARDLIQDISLLLRILRIQMLVSLRTYQGS